VETNADFRAISNENSEIHDGSKYYQQWTRLLDAGEDLRAFLEANKSSLKLKA
jgi:hypothetical protein